ncbi:MAG: hypothetical protein JNK75_07720 [Betaproteobacteria bacterium]|nr:hypothetical protein [Betaproteobacteria bacterium]
MNTRSFAWTPQRGGALMLCLLLGACATEVRRPGGPEVEVRPAEADTPSRPPRAATPVLQRLADEADALKPLAVSGLTLRFLEAVRALPPVSPRQVYINESTREYFSRAERDRLPEAQRARVTAVELDEYRYYYTKYGSPLAYLRPIEIAAAHGLEDVAGRRILDFGYGSIGHLRVLASLGAHVAGIDPDSYLDALYAEPSDQGAVPPARGARRGHPGTITLAHGYWPKDAAVVDRVGQGFDLFLSKNTLKKGYVKPERRTDRRQQVNLGVPDEAFLRTVHQSLNAGGLFLIYNISPKQSDKGGYNPQADGRSPFTREQYERAGFQVIAIDLVDDAAVRAVGRALGWDKTQSGEVTDLSQSIFAMYTLVKRP